jgi:hypothetical protein
MTNATRQFALAADTLGIRFEVVDVTFEDLPAGFEAARSSQPQALFLIGDAVADHGKEANRPAGRSASRADHVHRPIHGRNQRAHVVRRGGQATLAASRRIRLQDLPWASPTELPVELPVNFDLVINLPAARSMRLTLLADLATQVMDRVQ